MAPVVLLDMQQQVHYLNNPQGQREIKQKKINLKKYPQCKRLQISALTYLENG